MKINRLSIFSGFILISISSCISTKPFYEKSEKNWEYVNKPDSLHLKNTVFLIGDAGAPSSAKQEPVLKLLESQIYKRDTVKNPLKGKDSILYQSSEKDAVIFLGDNIYETGLPEISAEDRKEKERRIGEQLKIVKNFKGKKIFIPGNHDWNESRPGGLAALNREEAFIESALDSTDSFLPSNGCAGPVEIQMGTDLVIIVIDSEWWLSKFSKPLAPDNGCTSANRLDVIEQMKDIVVRNKGKNIVLAQHHPLFSNGTHGGHFSLKDYFFPLTLVRENLYIPLPIIGSIYPLLRQYGISRQDLSNKDYQQLKKAELKSLEDEKNLVIVTGHEHALQLNKYKNINHIISGAGSKSTSLIKGNDAIFSYGGGGAKGFSKLNYYTNGQCWVEFWEPLGDGSTGKLVYRAPLYAIPNKNNLAVENKLVEYSDSSKIMAAGLSFKASLLKRKIFGEHYRDTWATPINVKYLDLNNYAGGLTPLKMGGGHQTTSLQFSGKDGNIYQFRTIDKNPSALLPEGLQKTFAEDLIQDQISSAHPYGALAIPDMAKAIQIYHSTPQLYYLPQSTLLGPYIQQIGGKLGIIEAKPDEDLSDFNTFGNAKNAISTSKMYEKIKEDNDNEVDQKMFLKSRLFDLLIGDWDRHEDQWRWAEFDKKDKGKLYKPIPRDRDQVFTKFDGIFPAVMSLIVPDIQNFGYKIKDPAKLSIAARNLDRNLLNKLSKSDWENIANDIQIKLKDEVITKSVHKLPKEVYDKSGDEIIKKLIARRNQLLEVAQNYYNVLSKEVTISGSDKKEFIFINRQEKETMVSIFKINKSENTDTKIYERTFNNIETKTLNFYALNGKDSVSIIGKSANPIKIRIVGGNDDDNITDKGLGKTIIYDSSLENNKITKSNNTTVNLSNKPYINEYAINQFVYDKAGFIPSFDFNADDGLFIGAGYAIKHNGFRKQTDSFEQSLKANYAPKTGAHSIKYNGIFYNILGHNLDFIISGAYNGPKYTFNYYGEGNSTPNINDDINYYRVRTNNLSAKTFIQYRINDIFRIGIGPGYENFKVEKPDNRFITSVDFPDKQDIANTSRYLTLRSYAYLDFVNDKIFPLSGVKWHFESNYFKEIISNAKAQNFVQLRSDFSIYATPNYSFPVTAVFKIGAATNIGDYKFFQANSLGNNNNLRGFRNNRFTGKSYIYQNSELRFKVTNVRNYVFTGNLGVFSFYDSGRVYADNPENSNWHQAYGPGLWFNLFHKILISGSYGFSKEGQYISLKSGLTF